VSGLVVAARYLTIVPVPGRVDHSPDALGRSSVWFPVIGLFLGAALAITDRITSALFPTLLAALLVVTAWKLLTGGIHLDGLADCLDGLTGRDPGHRLAIMRDSRIGAFGAVGLILFLLLEIAALAELPAPVRWRALLVAPPVARALPLLLARWHPSARADGHGARFGLGVSTGATVTALALALIVSIGTLGRVGLSAAALATILVVALAAFMTRRLGGITGDVHGAAVEIAEVVILMTLAAWTHVRP
jgi:adenosylcobinamide-GDP ribazoletransferase